MTTTDTRCAKGCCPSQAEHYRTLAIGTGELNPAVADMNRRDAALAKDRDAYRRLRRDGLQPAHVDGSAEAEKRVTDQIELDYKIALPPAEIPRLKEIQAEVSAAQAVTDRAW